MLLSIIIPVYNEEKTLEQIIRKVKSVKLPKNLSKEIIVIDDGSTDKTNTILSKIKDVKTFSHKVNKGKGSAVIDGIKMCHGDIIIIQDADLEYDPNDYNRLLRFILDKSAEVVYGSRFLGYSFNLSGKHKTPLVSHYIGNRFLTFITNLLYGNKITDMETCYKVFRKKILKDITLESKRFEFEAEITAKILRKGIKIYEVPIQVKPRGYEEGKKISWKDGFIALFTLIRYRFTS